MRLPLAWVLLAPLLAGFPAHAAAQEARPIDVGTGAPPQAGIQGGAPTSLQIRVAVKSLKEIRWENVVRQRDEISCAAAALATILSHYFDFPTDEQEMLNALYIEAVNGKALNGLPPALADTVVRKLGFNLHHIRNVAQNGGLAAVAFRVEPRALVNLKIPVITRVSIKGYDHFVVLKEARHGRVYVADPAFGNTSYRLSAFEKIWSGVVMGFLRRNQALPAGHRLAVGPEDERNLALNDVARPSAPRVEDRPAPRVVLRASLFPFVIPSIEGLESALPWVIINQTEFGEAISF